MKKLSFLFAVILTITLFSCKKKEKPTESTIETPASTTNNYYGVLYCEKNDDLSTFHYNNRAIFSGSPITNDYYPANQVDAGNVSLNGVTYDKSISGPYLIYADTTNFPTMTYFGPTYTWSVTGGSGIPAFTYTYSALTPIFTGTASIINSTITLGQTNIVNLSGVTGADEIDFTLSNGLGTVHKIIPGNSSNVTLSATELAPLTSPGGCSMYIIFSKVSSQAFNNKWFKFKISYRVIITVTLV